MSASPPLDSLGNCVVCGTRTATRCSECASNGTKWMYFCSREHQKLIYKTHKRVCGKLSNPLRWPELTDKEAQKVRDSRSLTRKCYEGKTFGEEVPTWFGGSSLDLLVDFAKRPYGLGHDLVDSTKFNLIAILRAESLAVRVNRRVEVDDEIGEAEEMISDAFGSMIQNIGQSWQELCQRHNPLKNWIWWDTLMQRLLILYHLFALDLLELANGTQPSNLFVKHALREVINLLRREVTKTNPVEAQRLITFLIETFLSPENRVAFCTSWK